MAKTDDSKKTAEKKPRAPRTVPKEQLYAIWQGNKRAPERFIVNEEGLKSYLAALDTAKYAKLAIFKRVNFSVSSTLKLDS